MEPFCNSCESWCRIEKTVFAVCSLLDNEFLGCSHSDDFYVEQTLYCPHSPENRIGIGNIFIYFYCTEQFTKTTPVISVWITILSIQRTLWLGFHSIHISLPWWPAHYLQKQEWKRWLMVHDNKSPHHFHSHCLPSLPFTLPPCLNFNSSKLWCWQAVSSGSTEGRGDEQGSMTPDHQSCRVFSAELHCAPLCSFFLKLGQRHTGQQCRPVASHTTMHCWWKAWPHGRPHQQLLTHKVLKTHHTFWAMQHVKRPPWPITEMLVRNRLRCEVTILCCPVTHTLMVTARVHVAVHT